MRIIKNIILLMSIFGLQTALLFAPPAVGEIRVERPDTESTPLTGRPASHSGASDAEIAGQEASQETAAQRASSQTILQRAQGFANRTFGSGVTVSDPQATLAQQSSVLADVDAEFGDLTPDQLASAGSGVELKRIGAISVASGQPTANVRVLDIASGFEDTSSENDSLLSESSRGGLPLRSEPENRGAVSASDLTTAVTRQTAARKASAGESSLSFPRKTVLQVQQVFTKTYLDLISYWNPNSKATIVDLQKSVIDISLQLNDLQTATKYSKLYSTAVMQSATSDLQSCADQLNRLLSLSGASGAVDQLGRTSPGTYIQEATDSHAGAIKTLEDMKAALAGKVDFDNSEHKTLLAEYNEAITRLQNDAKSIVAEINRNKAIIDRNNVWIQKIRDTRQNIWGIKPGGSVSDIFPNKAEAVPGQEGMFRLIDRDGAAWYFNVADVPLGAKTPKALISFMDGKNNYFSHVEFPRPNGAVIEFSSKSTSQYTLKVYGDSLVPSEAYQVRDDSVVGFDPNRVTMARVPIDETSFDFTSEATPSPEMTVLTQTVVPFVQSVLTKIRGNIQSSTSGEQAFPTPAKPLGDSTNYYFEARGGTRWYFNASKFPPGTDCTKVKPQDVLRNGQNGFNRVEFPAPKNYVVKCNLDGSYTIQTYKDSLLTPSEVYTWRDSSAAQAQLGESDWNPAVHPDLPAPVAAGPGRAGILPAPRAEQTWADAEASLVDELESDIEEAQITRVSRGDLPEDNSATRAVLVPDQKISPENTARMKMIGQALFQRQIKGDSMIFSPTAKAQSVPGTDTYYFQDNRGNKWFFKMPTGRTVLNVQVEDLLFGDRGLPQNKFTNVMIPIPKDGDTGAIITFVSSGKYHIGEYKNDGKLSAAYEINGTPGDYTQISVPLQSATVKQSASAASVTAQRTSPEPVDRRATAAQPARVAPPEATVARAVDQTAVDTQPISSKHSIMIGYIKLALKNIASERTAAGVFDPSVKAQFVPGTEDHYYFQDKHGYKWFFKMPAGKSPEIVTVQDLLNDTSGAPKNQFTNVIMPLPEHPSAGDAGAIISFNTDGSYTIHEYGVDGKVLPTSYTIDSAGKNQSSVVAKAPARATVAAPSTAVAAPLKSALRKPASPTTAAAPGKKRVTFALDASERASSDSLDIASVPAVSSRSGVASFGDTASVRATGDRASAQPRGKAVSLFDTPGNVKTADIRDSGVRAIVQDCRARIDHIMQLLDEFSSRGLNVSAVRDVCQKAITAINAYAGVANNGQQQGIVEILQFRAQQATENVETAIKGISYEPTTRSGASQPASDALTAASVTAVSPRRRVATAPSKPASSPVAQDFTAAEEEPLVAQIKKFADIKSVMDFAKKGPQYARLLEIYSSSIPFLTGRPETDRVMADIKRLGNP